MIPLQWSHAGDVGGADTSRVVYALYASKNESLMTRTPEESERIALLKYTDTEFNHTGLNPGDFYFYKLYAKNRGVLRSEPLTVSLRSQGCPLAP